MAFIATTLGKIAEVCMSVFLTIWHCNLIAGLTKNALAGLTKNALLQTVFWGILPTGKA